MIFLTNFVSVIFYASSSFILTACTVVVSSFFAAFNETDLRFEDGMETRLGVRYLGLYSNFQECMLNEHNLSKM